MSSARNTQTHFNFRTTGNYQPQIDQALADAHAGETNGGRDDLFFCAGGTNGVIDFIQFCNNGCVTKPTGVSDVCN
jgi:hypothetical protein